MGGSRGGLCQKNARFKWLRGGACPPLNSPPVWGGLFCVLGGSGGEQAFQPIFDFQAAPPQCGGEQTADFGVLPPTLGGAGSNLGGFGGEQGGQLSEISKIKFPMTPPQSGGEHRGDFFVVLGGSGGEHSPLTQIGLRKPLA